MPENPGALLRQSVEKLGEAAQAVADGAKQAAVAPDSLAPSPAPQRPAEPVQAATDGS